MDSLGQLSARDSGTHRSVAAVLDVVLVVDCRIVHLLLAHTVHLIATLVQAVEASELTFVCKTSTRIWVVVVLWVLVRKPFHFLCEAAVERENQRANQSANKSPARHDAITPHTTCGALHNGSSACALKQSCRVHTEQTHAFKRRCVHTHKEHTSGCNHTHPCFASWAASPQPALPPSRASLRP